METTIIEARSDRDFEIAKELFQEYARAIEVDLCFQNFSAELDGIREMYGAPRGCLLLARDGEATIGCVGFRPVDADACEMKRLYVRPEGRGRSLGRELAAGIIERARSAGYRRIVLDTLVSMTTAKSLYRSLGFREIAPYYRNPLPDVSYLELDLSV